MTVAEQTTRERFEAWSEQLKPMEGVPMLVICCGVGENDHRGRVMVMNAQGKGMQEMIDLLRGTADQMEQALINQN